MPELRKDYFTRRLVLVSAERKNRPFEFKIPPSPTLFDSSLCPFCPGNEEMTPPADLVLVSNENTLLKLRILTLKGFTIGRSAISPTAFQR